MLATVSKEEAIAKLHAAKRHIATIRDKAEAGMEKAIQGVEVVAGAAAVGWYNGKNNQNGAPAQLMGYDADLAVGVGLVAAGLFDVAGKHSDHLFHLGAGALAGFAYREAYAKGEAAQTTAK